MRRVHEVTGDPPKVVSLDNQWVVAPPNEPVPELVSMIENYLEKARSGHLQSLACAAVYADGTTRTCWTGSYQASGALQMGAITYLFNRYVRNGDE